MTNFDAILTDVSGNGDAYMPYAGKTSEGEWLEGTISIEFLQENFGNLATANEMKAATESEGLRLYFDWLVSEGLLEGGDAE